MIHDRAVLVFVHVGLNERERIGRRSVEVAELLLVRVRFSMYLRSPKNGIFYIHDIKIEIDI